MSIHGRADHQQIMQERLCPACRRASLSVFFEMPDVPIYCNQLWPSHTAAVEAPRGDIRLGFCPACGLIYNVAFDPNLVSYTQAYENSLHYSPRFQTYATALATKLVKKYRLYGKDIIEIGCGKGEFLRLLCAVGRNRGVGFDASYDGPRGEMGEAADITFILDDYGETYADHTVALICCRHVLEHIPAPRPFLEHIRQAVGKCPAAAVFFEVPNVLYTLQELGIWDIIYEHCSYFSLPSLVQLFRKTGFVLHDVYTAFGEQFLCVEASRTADMPAPEAQWASEIEALRGLVESFAAHYRAKVTLWKDHLDRWREEGRCLAVWGAGSKGVTFLNIVEGGAGIRHIIDINPHKQGMYVAGTGQQILPPEGLVESRTDTILVMNPLYKDEIQAYIAQLGLRAELQVV